MEGCMHVVCVLGRVCVVQRCLPTKDFCKSESKWHKQLKGSRCTAYLTYLINSCQGAPHNGVLTTNCALFIQGLAERNARPQANQRSALCSRPHCSHLSHWLYQPALPAARRAPCPLPPRPIAYIHSFTHDRFVRWKTHMWTEDVCLRVWDHSNKDITCITFTLSASPKQIKLVPNLTFPFLLK